MTLFRGYGDDLPLMRWLKEKIWPVERKLEPEDVYWGTRLACLEMIRNGTARFWDMYWHPTASARAAQDAGMRATVAAPLIDVDGRSEAMREAALQSLDELADAGERIDVGLAPHAIYTVSEDSLRWIADAAGERRYSGPDPPVRDRAGGDRLPGRTRREARAVPRTGRAAHAAHRALPRRLARRRRARADRLNGRGRGHESGGQSQACGRRRVPVPAGARCRSTGRPGHRRSRLEQLHSTCSPT